MSIEAKSFINTDKKKQKNNEDDGSRQLNEVVIIRRTNELPLQCANSPRLNSIIHPLLHFFSFFLPSERNYIC